MSSANAARLRAVLAPYIAAGHRTAPPIPGCVTTPPTPSTAPAPRTTPEPGLGPVVGRVPQPGSVSRPGQTTDTAAPTTEKPAVTAPAPAPVSGASMPVVDRWQVKAMRQWARRHGYEVPAKGRIPDRVVAAYHQQAGTRRINIRSA